MNIEIHNPELEQRVREQIQRGQFHDLDDLLEKALDALEEKEIASAPPSHRERPAGRKSLVELFAESPLKGLDLDFSRNKSGAGPVDLS
jgi:Arc/MetJ-type ribon-helix-helix transcriptional regulator